MFVTIDRVTVSAESMGSHERVVTCSDSQTALIQVEGGPARVADNLILVTLGHLYVIEMY